MTEIRESYCKKTTRLSLKFFKIEYINMLYDNYHMYGKNKHNYKKIRVVCCEKVFLMFQIC